MEVVEKVQKILLVAVGEVEMVQDQNLEVLLMVMVGEKDYCCYCLSDNNIVIIVIYSIDFSNLNKFMVFLVLVL